MMSACVKWAKEEVEEFNAILARQLSSVERGSDAWQECMDRARIHAQMLVEVHLDFRDLIGREVLNPDTGAPNEAVGLGVTQ